LFSIMQVLLVPFEFIESRWKIGHHLCYLLAAEVEKPAPL